MLHLFFIASHPDEDINYDLMVVAENAAKALEEWDAWMARNEWESVVTPKVFHVAAVNVDPKTPAGALEWDSAWLKLIR